MGTRHPRREPPNTPDPKITKLVFRGNVSRAEPASGCDGGGGGAQLELSQARQSLRPRAGPCPTEAVTYPSGPRQPPDRAPWKSKMESALPRLRVSPLERGFHSLPPPSLGLSACEKVRPAALEAWGAPRPARQPWAAFPPGAAGAQGPGQRPERFRSDNVHVIAIPDSECIIQSCLINLRSCTTIATI